MKEFFADIELKKAAIIGGSFIGVISLVAVALFFFWDSGEKEEDSGIVETMYFPKEDSYQVETTVRNFVKNAGNFGFDYKKAYEINSIAESVKIALADPQAENAAFISRHTAYSRVRDSIAKNSPLYYSASQTLSWENTIEVGGDNQRMFSASDATVTIPETMGESDFGGVSHNFIDVNVVFDSKVSFANQTSHDVSWDGEVQIYAKDFDNEKFTLRMINIDGVWKIYSISGLDNEFLLATWALPEFNYIQSKVATGFEVEESFFIELPNLEEMPPIEEVPVEEAPIEEVPIEENNG